MRYQSRKSSCGPASLVNALEALGIGRSEDEIGALSKQDTNGTTSSNLRKAAEAVGVEVMNVCEQREEVAGWLIESQIRSGHPGIIVVDNDEHWISVVGILGNTFIVADPADNDLLLFYSLTGLLTRWRSPNGKYAGFFLVNEKENV
jgi:ABC-type bacteriocin/lantibiotic exporter with double-glycine peptidase domain